MSTEEIDSMSRLIQFSNVPTQQSEECEIDLDFELLVDRELQAELECVRENSILGLSDENVRTYYAFFIRLCSISACVLL